MLFTLLHSMQFFKGREAIKAFLRRKWLVSRSFYILCLSLAANWVLFFCVLDACVPLRFIYLLTDCMGTIHRIS